MARNYYLPSAKKLAETFSIELSTAKRAREVMRGDAEIDEFSDEFPATSAWIRQCHHYPDEIELQLSALDELLRGFGVECIGESEMPFTSYGAPRVSYINQGDTYNATMAYDHDEDRWRLTCWGDEHERIGGCKKCQE